MNARDILSKVVRLPFSDINAAPVANGVYVIFGMDDQIIYIGQGNIRRRLAAPGHGWNGCDKGRIFKDQAVAFGYFIEPDRNLRLLYEMRLIESCESPVLLNMQPHMTESTVRQIRHDYHYGGKYSSELARIYGTCVGTITNIADRRTYRFL